MTHTVKFAKNWWLLTIVGLAITLLGFWVYKNPIENYIALSILFSVVIFISGILEIIFAITNSKIIKGWGWMLTSGIFDLIIGIILVTKEDITMAILPIIFGIWLIFRGISQVSRGILIKQAHLKNWGWPIIGGFLVIAFGFMVIYSPQFGAASIIIWTALSLILLGLLTILFSVIIKKLNTIYND
jgi:uncharacterized membrane protein HdeD (DUF308 family)